MTDTLIGSRTEALLPPGMTRILVVEDDPAIADVLRMNMQANGFAVSVANDGVAALQVFESENPDLVTLDLDVPKVSGHRLIQLFKKSDASRRVPVIVITALDYEEARDVIDAGADDFLTKPFDRNDLLQKIDFALNRRLISQ